MPELTFLRRLPRTMIRVSVRVDAVRGTFVPIGGRPTGRILGRLEHALLDENVVNRTVPAVGLQVDHRPRLLAGPELGADVQALQGPVRTGLQQHAAKSRRVALLGGDRDDARVVVLPDRHIAVVAASQPDRIARLDRRAFVDRHKLAARLVGQRIPSAAFDQAVVDDLLQAPPRLIGAAVAGWIAEFRIDEKVRRQKRRCDE